VTTFKTVCCLYDYLFNHFSDAKYVVITYLYRAGKSAWLLPSYKRNRYEIQLPVHSTQAPVKFVRTLWTGRGTN